MPTPQQNNRAKLLAIAAFGIVAVAVGYVAIVQRARRRRLTQPVIEELWIYPVKGCRGSRVPVAELSEVGFKYDREWVILKNDSKRTVMTLRNCPKLATIHAVVNEDEGDLVLTHAIHGTLRVPLQAHAVGVEPTIDYEVWDSHGQARSEGKAAASWLNTVLGVDVALYRTTQMRHIASSPRAGEPTDRSIMNQDEAAVMIISEDTVRQIRDACGDPTIDCHRFRPNIVLGTHGARDEETYRELRYNGIRLQFLQFCERCTVPTVRDDATFHPKFEPLKTLRERFSAAQPYGDASQRRPIAGIDVRVIGRGLVRADDVLEVMAVGAPPVHGKETPR
jgi:uncharacterized protein YcbX